jgi:hypothetical protein
MFHSFHQNQQVQYFVCSGPHCQHCLIAFCHHAKSFPSLPPVLKLKMEAIMMVVCRHCQCTKQWKLFRHYQSTLVMHLHCWLFDITTMGMGVGFHLRLGAQPCTVRQQICCKRRVYMFIPHFSLTSFSTTPFKEKGIPEVLPRLRCFSHSLLQKLLGYLI